METPKSTLKYLSLFFAILVATKLLSCGDATSKEPANEAGFKTIEAELKNKFGDNAYYTDLAISYDISIGNVVMVIVTKNPESLQMGQWSLSQDSWTQNSDITLEVPKGTKASDFMFQLNDKISLAKLGALIEKSGKQLQKEKNIDHPILSIATVKFPKNGDISKTEYVINLKPEHGGTTYSFYYKLNGELIKMDF
ncbi:hypothetical protein [Winogradskyella forsetii]|uniref:hypothetical protein n=1 Tax=Winogradskyella forsetii TaxID=2686077 RepID=UPI0015BF9C5E|nr:hypothetical protein [Winogradskyella forsetii]